MKYMVIALYQVLFFISYYYHCVMPILLFRCKRLFEIVNCHHYDETEILTRGNWRQTLLMSKGSSFTRSDICYRHSIKTSSYTQKCYEKVKTTSEIKIKVLWSMLRVMSFLKYDEQMCKFLESCILCYLVHVVSIPSLESSGRSDMSRYALFSASLLP